MKGKLFKISCHLSSNGKPLSGPRGTEKSALSCGEHGWTGMSTLGPGNGQPSCVWQPLRSCLGAPHPPSHLSRLTAPPSPSHLQTGIGGLGGGGLCFRRYVSSRTHAPHSLPDPFGNCRHDDEVECPHYLLDSKGTRVGCHFDKLAEPKRTDNYFFLVNGTSKHTAIQFVDFTPFKAVQMGKTMSRLPWSPAVPGASRVPRCVSLCSWTAWGWHAGARE